MGKKNKKKCNTLGAVVTKPEIENVMVNAKQHKILWKYLDWLQDHYNVRICLPRTKPLNSDIIIASIEGLPQSINGVKTFIGTEVDNLSEKDIESPPEDDVEVITLSDSESEEESKETCSVSEFSSDISASKNNARSSSSTLQTYERPCSPKERRGGKKRYYKETMCSPHEGGLNIVTSTTDDDLVMKKARLSESVLIVEDPHTSNQDAGNLSQSVLILEEPCTSNHSAGTSSQSADALSESVLIVNELDTRIKPAEDFIPLMQETKSANKKIKQINKRSWFKPTNSGIIVDADDIKIIDEPEPIVVSRQLRPIVIDGSNVAMEHGKPNHCFSVKGIKIAIDYFLNRGHTKVTAFVPKYRRSRNPNRSFPTTDVDLFDELERQQLVVFTPSRRIDGKCISSYDDRFIIKLASTNGGVILSNDNYRDLLDVSTEFKEAIEKRLLQFCFVEDQFMIPDDPLGRKGPTLDEFLSFPPDEDDS